MNDLHVDSRIQFKLIMTNYSSNSTKKKAQSMQILQIHSNIFFKTEKTPKSVFVESKEIEEKPSTCLKSTKPETSQIEKFPLFLIALAQPSVLLACTSFLVYLWA